MTNNILLLTINDKKNLYASTESLSAIQPNIGMGLLDSYLESKGIAVEMIDETSNYSIAEIIDIIETEQPVLFGVICSGANPSASTMSMVGAIKFFKELGDRKGQSNGFIQGGHPSVLPKRTLEETGADYLIRGEGYKTIEQLYRSLISGEEYPNIEGLAYIKDGEYIGTNFPKLIDVKELPMVNWEKMNPNKYRAHNWHSFGGIKHRSPYGVIWTSLGCPHNCSFCCTNNVFGQRTYRMRDMQEVLKEIDVLVLQYGVKNIKILDELFVINHPRIEEFYQGLKQRKYDLNMWCYARTDSVTPEILKKLREVGVKWIAYGIESTNQKVLGDIGKGCSRDFYDSVIKITKDAGMYFGIDIITGLWLDNFETMEETYQWCVGHNFEWLNMYPAFALPGTKLYDDCIKDGRRETPKDWSEYSLYGYNCFPLNSKYLTREQILEWRDNKFLEYYSRPEYLDMMENKFGLETRNHIVTMANHRLPRRILEGVTYEI